MRLCERCHEVEKTRPAAFCGRCGEKIHWVWKLPYPFRVVASVFLLIGAVFVAVLTLPFSRD